MAEDGELREQRQEMAMTGTLAMMAASVEFAMEMEVRTTLLAGGASRVEATILRMTVMGRDMLADAGMPATMLLECWPTVMRLTILGNATTFANPYGSCDAARFDVEQLAAATGGLDAGVAGLLDGPLGAVDLEAYAFDRLVGPSTARYTYRTTMDLGGIGVEVDVAEDVKISEGRFQAGVATGTATIASEALGAPVAGNFAFDGRSAYTYGVRAPAPSPPLIE